MTDLLRCALATEPNPDLAAAARRPFIADHVLQGLTEARRVPSHATPNLARWFRKTRTLGSRDRRIVSEIVYGIIRHEALFLRAGARSDTDLVRFWADMADGERFESMEAMTPAEDYSTALNLPGAVASAWLDALGAEEAAALGQCLGGRAPTTLRCNRLKADRDEVAKRLADEGVETRPTERAPDGLHVINRANLPALQSFRDGLYEVQDESGQLLCEAIPLEPDMRVMDLCAGSGGKSLALAARGAHVHAFDIRDDALRNLVDRAERAGAPIIVDTPEPAPVVLVDAPCSGSGRLMRNPALRWGLDALPHLAAQREVLDAGASLVEPGGLLVYATCSLLPTENAHAPTDGDWTELEQRTLWPHRDGTDGFFWVMWRRG